MTEPSAQAVASDTSKKRSFEVHLPVFSGPFDLLLSLIAKHKLDVTEVALAEVADDFVAHLRTAGFDLDQATEFLVVAATLLDLKAARLLPTPAGDDEEEDLALLEARDLLFARLLQYRAYKRAAALLAGLEMLEARHTTRLVALEEPFAAALPEVVIPVDAAKLAEIAGRLREPKEPPQVAIDHVHAPRIDIKAHSRAVVERLRAVGTASFRNLCSGCTETLEVVVRFLALLELHRDGTVAFDQPTPLGDLTVTWIGGAGSETPPDEQEQESA
ncbi:MAG TPA: ScpA family protein [Frankiaceae bacterium]|nr:ScpA family protein [Frankiaceae bacterium]